MKVHLIDDKTRKEDFVKSPHIFKAIETKRWAVCHQILPETHITRHIPLVTCKACLTRYNSVV